MAFDSVPLDVALSTLDPSRYAPPRTQPAMQAGRLPVVPAATAPHRRPQDNGWRLLNQGTRTVSHSPELQRLSGLAYLAYTRAYSTHPKVTLLPFLFA